MVSLYQNCGNSSLHRIRILFLCFNGNPKIRNLGLVWLLLDIVRNPVSFFAVVVSTYFSPQTHRCLIYLQYCIPVTGKNEKGGRKMGHMSKGSVPLKELSQRLEPAISGNQNCVTA